MGFAKRLIEEDRERHAVAMRIALEAGVLKECPYHEEVYDPLGADPSEAYELGRQKLASGALGKLFSSQEQLEAAIHEAITETSSECYLCEKHKEA